MKTYTVTLADGRQIKDLMLNGNCFVSDVKIDEDIFKDNLGTFTVTEDGQTVWHSENVIFVAQQSFEGKWLLCFAEKSPAEIEKERLEAQITELQTALAETYEAMEAQKTEMQLAVAEAYEAMIGA